MGHWHVPPSTFNCVDVCLLLCCFRFIITQTHVDVVSHFTGEYMGTYRFVTVYCMSFIIFLCFALNIFS